jgi:hypothetical protein
MVMGKTGTSIPCPIKPLVSQQIIIGEVIVPGDFFN